MDTVSLSFPLVKPHPTNPSGQIKRPLGQHPRQTRRCHNQRRNEPALKDSTPKTQPLADKVYQRNAIGPNSQVVGHRRGDIIRCVATHHRRQKSPGAKHARCQRVRERFPCRSVFGVVQLSCVRFGAICLQAVGCTDHRDLGIPVSCRSSLSFLWQRDRPRSAIWAVALQREADMKECLLPL